MYKSNKSSSKHLREILTCSLERLQHQQQTKLIFFHLRLASGRVVKNRSAARKVCDDIKCYFKLIYVYTIRNIHVYIWLKQPKAVFYGDVLWEPFRNDDYIDTTRIREQRKMLPALKSSVQCRRIVFGDKMQKGYCFK